MVTSTTVEANTSTIEKHMDAADAQDWLWTFQEEPHRTRRMQIIKAHPEVTKLCGPEPLTKWVVLLVVSIQMTAAYLLRNTPFFSWTFFLTTYIVGATASQNLFLAIHEISHNLAFRKPIYNRMLAMFANLPIGIPYSASFRPYHLIHHKAMGVEGLDTDLPTKIEVILLNSVLGKTFFCTFQILFYALRPMAVLQLPFTMTHFWNVIVQVVFDIILVKYITGWQGLIYFVFSDFLAGSLHPLAAHFISEHYVFDEDVKPSPKNAPLDGPPPPETFSYYGPLNFFTYNVGLHNEHHDFPAVPWTRLHKLREIASEFYDPLPVCDSWPMTIPRFIFHSKRGLWGRVKREDKKKASIDVDKED